MEVVAMLRHKLIPVIKDITAEIIEIMDMLQELLQDMHQVMYQDMHHQGPPTKIMPEIMGKINIINLFFVALNFKSA